MQLTQNPNKLGILATLLTVSTLATLSSVQSKFLFERLSFNQHKAAKNPVLASDSIVEAHKDTHLLQQSAAAVNQSIVLYNLTWLNTQNGNATDDYINNTNPRLQTSIRLDKEAYAPNDVLFAEVLLLNALNKTPVANLSTDNTIKQYYNLTFEILDTGNNVIYTSTQLPVNSTVAFYYRINSTLPSGTYVVRTYNQHVPVTTTSFVLQAYNKDPAVVSIQLPRASYNLGDVIRAIVQVTAADGSYLPVTTTVSYNVSFGNITLANTTLVLSTYGDSVILFNVPSVVTAVSPVITFTVKTANWTYVYQQTLVINNPSLLVIDFFPDTGYITYNVPNTIYFQAWTNSQRTTPLDIANATIRQYLNKTNQVVLYGASVSSLLKGKGSFVYTPVNGTGVQDPTFEVTINGVTYVRSVTFAPNTIQSTNQAEVSIKILNTNRVLNNADDLKFQIIANGTVNASATYIVSIMNAEVALWQNQYNLFANSTTNVTVPAKNFSFVSGGVLSLTIVKVSSALETFYKSRPASVSATNTTNTTNSTSNSTTNTTKTNTTTTNTTTTNSTTNSTKTNTTTNSTSSNTTTTNTTNSTKTNTTTNSTTNTTNSTTNTSTATVKTYTYTPPDYANTTVTTTFYEPKGELLFFKRPADGLKLQVTFNKASSYLPGDTVSYTVNIVNITTGKAITMDSYVTLSVTDIAGLTLNNGVSYIPTFASKTFLVNQIKNFDNELIYAQDIINSMIVGSTNDTRYFELVLGVQNWRVGAFDVKTIVNSTAILNKSSDAAAIQQLYSNVVFNQTKPVTAVVKAAAIRTGKQGNDTVPQDFMFNATNARSFSKGLRSGWQPTSVVDMTQTVQWTSTGYAKTGVLKGSFVLNDKLTSYVFSADAFTMGGLLGAVNTTLTTTQQLTITYSTPQFLVLGDSLKIPVTISNQGQVALSVRLYETLNDQSLKVVVPTSVISVAANAAVQSFITVTGVVENSVAMINLVANSSASGITYTSSSMQNVTVAPQQFIFRYQTIGGLIGSNVKTAGSAYTQVMNLQVPVDANTTLQKMYLNVYPTFLSLLAASKASLAANPQANLEEITAALYPSILRLAYLRNATQTSDVQVQIIQLVSDLSTQYSQLLTYLLNDSGNYKFDGQDLSYEAMTAYALVFFTDLYSNGNNTFVDPSVLNGLYNYLLTRRNGRGGFIQSFSPSSNGVGIDQLTHDTYVLYALSYYNASVNVTLEVTTIRSSIDNQVSAGAANPYLLALISNSLYRMKQTAVAQNYADLLVKAQNLDGSPLISNPAAITFNGGLGSELSLQTAALSVLAWNNNQARYISSITNATNYLYMNNRRGMFGHSGATVNALKAIQTTFLQYDGLNGNGTYTLTINNQLVNQYAFTTSQTDAIAIDVNSFIKNNSQLVGAAQNLIVQLTLVNASINKNQTRDFRAIYSFVNKFQTNTSYVAPPPVNTTSEFLVTLNVGKTPIGLDAQTGKKFNYTVSVKNIMTPGVVASGPVNVVIGAPSCLGLDLTYANSLVAMGTIVGYEIVDSGLTVLLMRSFVPGETRLFNVQYVQNYSGTCMVRDNLAYQTNGDFQLAAKTKTV